MGEGICVRCGEEKRILARGLCSCCYNHERRRGNINKYRRINRHGGIRKCKNCGKIKTIFARDLCQLCYTKWYNKTHRFGVDRKLLCKGIYETAKELSNDPESITNDSDFVKLFLGFICPRLEEEKASS